jgi:hypothetical protein
LANNPLTDQGQINRLLASVNVTNFTALNVTPSYLGREGISIAFEGEGTTYIPTMTGGVTSPEPYQIVMVTMHLLKSQALASAYKSQFETSSLLGPISVYPDSAALPAYDFTNAALMGSPRDLNLSGADAGFLVTMRAYYNINNALWNG